MAVTEYYDLQKPAVTDGYAITIINQNMDTIDTALKQISDAADSGGSGGLTGPVGTDDIQDAAVTTEKLAGDAVTADRLANDAVATDNIQARAVTTDRLATKSVTTNELGDKAVTTDKIADYAVTGDKISNNTVKAANIADNAVETDAIKDKAVTTEKIADYSITQNKLAQGAVANNRIQNAAVDTRTIADAAVTADKLSEKYIKAKESTVLDQEFPDGDYSTIIYRIEDSYEDPNKGLTETCSHYILSGVKDDEYVWEKILTGTISSENTSFCNYSTKPVRIGTWIDGTPIWRKAFNADLDMDDIAWQDKGWSPIKPSDFADAASVCCIGGAAFLRVNSTPYFVDDYACGGLSNAGATFEWLGNTAPAGAYAGIYGYIDFVTAESNILST